MKRVAIPVMNENLSEYFGQCSHYKIYDVDKKVVNVLEMKVPEVEDVHHLPEWASEKGITDIITHRLDKRIIRLFSKYKINLYVGIPIDSPDHLIEDYINEKLVSNNKIITEIIESE